MPVIEVIKAHVLARLEHELSPHLLYHGIHHTRDDVLPAAERFAQLSKVRGEDLLLLQTAALYHDIGFIENRYDHEAIGARMAAEELVDFGFNDTQIERICSMIMATHLPQSPRDDLEALLCDADMDSLGRDDFFATSHHLRLELMRQGEMVSLKEWSLGQLRFLQGHTYFSKAAHRLRDEQKQHNINELLELFYLR